MDFDDATNKNLMLMLFISQMDVLMGTPGKHNWWEMGYAEKEQWRVLHENFRWPDDEE